MPKVTRRMAVAGLGAAPLLAGAHVARAAPVPPTIDELIRKPATRGAAISPDGARIAVVKQDGEGASRVAYVDIMHADDADLKRTRVPLGDLDVNGLSWGGNDRLLISVIYKQHQNYIPTGSLTPVDIVTTLYRIVAMDADGANQVLLLGKDRDIAEANPDLSEIIDWLPDDKNRVLMRAWGGAFGKWSLYYVDIRSGEATLCEDGTIDTTWWYTEKGVPVLRQDTNSSGSVLTLYARAQGEKDWKFVRKVRVDELDRLDFQIIGPTEEANVWLARTNSDTDSAAVLRSFDLKTLVVGDVVAQHAGRDLYNCLVDGHRRYLGASYIDDRLAYEFADASFAGHFRGINHFFDNDANVDLVQVTDDHNRFLMFVSGPTDPGGYYFYDRKATRLQGLDLAFPWLTPDRLGKVEMLDIKTRDGTVIRAYLTVPLATGPRPLVVMPHGGPESRDSYDFDVFAQTFAAQGWMVLQPNFRGSGGYGNAFAEAGHKHWGDRMQEDVDDAVAQVLATGRVDPKRVAIWGWSYGGYAALEGAVRHPELYRSAVSGAGISDLAAMLATEQKNDPDGPTYHYWVENIGDPKTDAAAIADASPRNHAAAIKSPLLLLHGTEDKVVDPAQSKVMADAMHSAGRPVSYVVLPGAGHHVTDWDDKTYKTILQTSVDFIAKSFA